MMRCPSVIRQRGAALMLVLWLIVLLTALIGSFALSARVESMQGRGLARRVVAEQVARAGLELAIDRLQDPDPDTRWVADGRAQAWTFAGAEVTLWIRDESGKVDLNAAPAPLLAALLREAGATAGQAETLAAAIVDWRDADDLVQPQGAEHAQYQAAGLSYGPRNAPFESVAELQRVLGMDAALYARVRPNVTVYSGLVLPMTQWAPPDVRAALSLDTRSGRANAPRIPGTGSGTYSIEVVARMEDGREGRLQAVVRTQAGRRYTALEWKEGSLLQ